MWTHFLNHLQFMSMLNLLVMWFWVCFDVVWVVFGHRIMSIYWVIAPWR
jgi:hypothetical protein